ncbi:MAG TPA: hypothetical protein VKR06_08290 [Ktedonosporobacter sp.]|nr:hypothetical protein [Ktedonosporobacter sp.]
MPTVRLRSLRGNPRKGPAWSPGGLLLRDAGKPQRTEMIFSLHACCVTQGLEETIRVVPSNESGNAPAHNRAASARWFLSISEGNGSSDERGLVRPQTDWPVPDL